MAECQVCGAAVVRPVWCPDCQALAYCGSKHLKQHAQETHAGEECARMRSQMQSGPAIRSDDLEFSDLLAADTADDDHVCLLLEALGAHNSGAYASLCICHKVTERVDDHTITGLPSAGNTAADPPICAQIHSWSAYCSWRGMSLSSPAPLILTWPLALWHSVECLLPSKPAVLMAAPERASATQQHRTLRILVAGADAVEVTQQACLMELLHLWPQLGTIMVALIGPHVAAPQHGTVKVHAHNDGRAVHVACFQGCAHQEMDSIASFLEHPHRPSASSEDLTQPCRTDQAAPPEHDGGMCSHLPDVAFCPNAGLAAYTTWEETLKLLAEAQVGKALRPLW
eukprot:jgi/Ulvmu1/2701/UM014_0157.1